jgi:hypothetical protein
MTSERQRPRAEEFEDEGEDEFEDEYNATAQSQVFDHQNRGGSSEVFTSPTRDSQMKADKPPSRDWRAQPPAQSLYAREWRGARGGPTARFSRKFKLRVVGLALMALVAVIAIMWGTPGDRVPSVQVVTFSIGAYGGRANPQGNMPVNPFGEQDARAFRVLNELHPAQFPPVRQEDNALNGAQFLSFLQSEANAPGLNGQHLIVFCTLHGLVQPSGDVELFAIDATPDSPGTSSGTMVPLKELVNRLQESRARRVLLVLDAARLDAQWRLGILNNDIAAQVASDWPPHSSSPDARPASDAEKIAILLAAAPGQHSWPAEDQSALAQFLIEGLTGAADGWEDGVSTGTSDRRVSLHELTAFVRHHVEEWTRRHYGVVQTVQLLGNVTDFDLAIVSPSSSSGGKLSDVKPSSLKPSSVKPSSLKSAAVKAGKSSGKKEKDEGTEQPDSPEAESTETPATAESKSEERESSTETGATAKPAKGSTGVKWDVRLAELWKVRDEWRDVGRQGRHAVCRQMPLAWRAFEAQLALAEALQRGGLDELSPQAVQQAEAAYKKLQSSPASLAGLELTANEAPRRSLQDLGFVVESNPPAPEVLAAAGKYLLSLLKEKPGAGAKDEAATSPTPNSNSKEPDASAIQAWLRQELRRDASAENWDHLKQIVNRLKQIERLPTTAETLLLRDVLTAEDGAARLGKGEALQRIFALRDRYRRLAVRSPESLPLVREAVQSGMRSLNAAERWLLAADAERPEVRDWLDKSDQAATQAESMTQRYGDTVGIWSDLLAELPAAAQWVATRANDDDHRKVDWQRLRDVARQWAERERDGKWEVEPFQNLWPDKPARWTDLERLLLAQFIDAQRLKVALLQSDNDGSSQRLSSDELSKLSNQAAADRSDFWEEVRRSLPRLGTADHPTPSVWREADRLLAQPWLPNDERRKLNGLRRLEPRGDPLPNRSAEAGSLWQGYWAIATLSLLSQNPEETAGLWKDWERLAELSRPSTAARTPSDAEQEALRKRRAELGRAIRQQWSALQSRAQSAKTATSLPAWHLVAATLDPTLLPEADPDVHLRDERQRQFADWLTVFAADWRSRTTASASPETLGYAALAEQAERLSRELGGAPPRSEVPIQVRFQDEKRPSFDAQRRARLNLSITPGAEAIGPMKVLIAGSQVRLVEGTNQTPIRQAAARPLPANGQLAVDLKLDDDVESAQPLLVTLTEADGYPLDFRRILLYPPFDPSQWRIEFVEAATNTPLENVPLSSAMGIKVFLPPMAAMSIRANLVRPVKDSTASAKVSIFRLTESSRVPLLEDLDFKLEAGKERTPILCDLPAPPKDKEKEKESAKEKALTEPLADLARGWLFVITPEGQKPLEYLIRPTFWSATKFIDEPQPIIRDDRFTLDLERRAASAEDVLLPKKIPVELSLPDSLRNTLTNYTLGGPIAVGQQLTLSFALPRNWSDQARDRNWNLALDVAGLPHAHRWRIEPSGNVTPISGQPPQLDIRLLLPPPEPKAPPRLESVVRKGKESLHLQFQVDATELDRTEETGDWTLSYTIVREAEGGNEPTPLQHSWRLFSSVQRHVLLDVIQGGVWKLRTAANDYEKEEPESEIRGLSGRFQVQATLTRAAQPQQALATAKLRFAIDDDAPPALEVKGLTSEPRLGDKDLSFRIEAADLESGIQRLVLGIDKNGDKQLQEDEEAIEERSFIGLDNPKVGWPVIVSRTRLPKLEKDEETRHLIVQARNGLGAIATRVVPITFRKPAVPLKLTTGTLVVNLKLSRGAKASIQLSGPEAHLEETKADSTTFTNLPAGQYQINVKVNYAVIGRKEAGEAKVEVKVGRTTTSDVPLSAAK